MKIDESNKKDERWSTLCFHQVAYKANLRETDSLLYSKAAEI